jgi:DNA invertase Pin-like site-specific DNA recombinase
VLTDNDRSASRYATKDRPEYARLRDLLGPGDVLVMWEASRAQRDLTRYVELRDLCTERGVWWSYSGRVFDLGDGDDRFTTGLDALLAEKEAEQARTRIMRAHRANLAAGRPHGRLPYGYRVVRDERTGKAIGREPDPARAPLVREAARRVLDGHSLGSVVRWLESADPVGWRVGKLTRLLGNPTLAGYRTHRGTVHGAGTWEPLLSDDELADLQALFAGARIGPRGLPPKHLLSGVAECGECGGPMWRRKGGTRKDGSAWDIYECRDGCVARRKDIVDDAVCEVVEALLSDPAARAALAAAPGTDPGGAARLAELRQRLAAVEDQVVDGKIPAASGATLLTRLTEQIEAAEAAAGPAAPVVPVVRELATAPDAVAVWRGLQVDRRREFLKAALLVRIDRTGKGRWGDRRAGIVVEPRRPGA